MANAYDISIHAPAKGATRLLLHVGIARIAISIHAPAKGATPVTVGKPASLHISIHAPAKGATADPVPRPVHPGHFNPRSREGSDVSGDKRQIAADYFNPRSREGSDGGLTRVNERGGISIHAPAKGATTAGLELPQTIKFQSTLPRRERPTRH